MHLTRRELVVGAGATAALAAAGLSGTELLPRRRRIRGIASFGVKPSGPVRAFRSRPDLRPPTVATTAAEPVGRTRATSPGYLFLGPGPVSLSGSQEYGPLIVDRRGEPVWFRPLAPGLQLANFGACSYRGDPVLIWWEGRLFTSGYGQGEAVIVDRSYRELYRVRAAGGRSMDLHGLWLTPQGTALFTCYPEIVPADLRPVGGPRHGQAYESTIQEVDVATGRLLFEWRSLQHVPIGDSYEPLRGNYDYLHINSIAPAADGNLLVSGRHTWALYKLDRRTGEVIWTLGGKRSQFRLGHGAEFAWQHDARQLSDRVLTLFDNGTNGPIETERGSRGLVLDVDESGRTVALRKAYRGPKPMLASAMGSVQALDSGEVVVCWGTASHTSAFDRDGRLSFDAALPAGMYSYRGSRLEWHSAAGHRPALTAGAGRDGRKVIYASWNGATRTRYWRLDAGPGHDSLRPVGVARRRGFETVIPVRRGPQFAAVTALDHRGHTLASSPAIRL
jgi:hypothetical protein